MTYGHFYLYTVLSTFNNEKKKKKETKVQFKQINGYCVGSSMQNDTIIGMVLYNNRLENSIIGWPANDSS